MIVIQDIGCHDLEIVPRRVRKRASAIAVSHRPDARHVGAQLIVHLNIAVRINGDAGLVQSKVVRIRPPTDRHQHMSSNDLRNLPGQFDLHGNRVSLLLDTDHLAADAHVDVFLLEELGHGAGDVLVLARDQARCQLDHRHLTSEAAIDLREFEADVTAAQDDEMRGEKIDVHHRAVGEVRHLVEAGDRRDRRPPAHN